MDMLSGETEVRDYALERLMMLSDGVFAIAMDATRLRIAAARSLGSRVGGAAGPNE